MKKQPRLVVGVFCLDRDRRLCFVRTCKQPDELTLPGGGVEFGETLKEAAARELKEETSTIAQNLSYVGWGEIIDGCEKHWVYFDYQCATAEPLSIPLVKGEVLEVVWLSIQDAKTDSRISRRLRDEIDIYFKK